MGLDRSELRSWHKLIRGIQELLDALDRQLRDEAGLTHHEYGILSRLYRERGRAMRMTGLARDVSSSPSRLSHAIRRLEAEGWVTRTPDSTDGRVVMACLTEMGVAKVRAVSPDHLALVRSLVFDTLGPDGARETADAIDRVRRAAESA